MLCKKCGENFDSTFFYCPYCGTENKIAIQNQYNDIYGVWKVETEEDCEGRGRKDLGTHEGYVDEIAFSLANQCFYSLEFTKVGKGTHSQCKKNKKEINIRFNYNAGFNNMSNEQITEKLEKTFKDRPVTVEKSNYYACIKLVSK